MRLEFNTGRKYTVNGQRIIATRHSDGVVTFHDVSRMIAGQFICEDAERFTQAQVMARYDAYAYERTSRADRDAFSVGGCNAP